MILSIPTPYPILVGLLVLIIMTYGNYSDMPTSEASVEGSTGNNTLDASIIPTNILSNETSESATNSAQKDIPFSDKFEVINKTAENDTLYMEPFDSQIKIILFGPTVNDPNLRIETVFKGINFPSNMAFIGNDDILVLEKDTGKVRRIINGSMLDQPLLDVHVGNKNERGLLGIAIAKQKHENTSLPSSNVFLYYTETRSKDGEDVSGGLVTGNRLYKYELENNTLINPKLLLDLPGEPGGDHQGGVVLVGPDNNIYLSFGDVNHFTRAQNNINGNQADGTGGILRITQDGEALQASGILGSEGMLNKYYAYGIRNSYGIDFDPVTNYLWDTENGVNCCDEINLVEPGFNSGWKKVQGISGVNQSDDRIQTGIYDESQINQTLFDFNGKGKYSSPEFVWNFTVGPTALKFFNSTKLGEQYQNDMFIGDVNTQSLYRFDLSKDRKELQIPENLFNKISQTGKDLKAIQFGLDFGRITDIDVGPDGNLYVLSHKWNNANQSEGSIYRISKSVDLGKNFTHENMGWINYDQDVLSISTETDSPISGNGSLKVDIRKAVNVAETVNSSWSAVSTDFIPIKEDQYYDYGLELSAKNVNQLHSKVIYYDSNKNEINSDYVFRGRDGTFDNKYRNSFLAPK